MKNATWRGITSSKEGKYSPDNNELVYGVGTSKQLSFVESDTSTCVNKYLSN